MNGTTSPSPVAGKTQDGGAVDKSADAPARKILVVDDHLHLAENIAEVLALAGYDTTVAESAEAALERVARGGVAALVTDFRLPGKNGAELIAELRRRGSDIPAIVMSAYTDDGTIESSHEAGAFEVLPKPVDLRRLVALVEALGRTEAVVLVVDDNQALAENIAETFAQRGYTTMIGTTAVEALAALPRPRAAVIDYRLAEGDGISLAERLKTRDPGIRLLFISAYLPELRDRLRGHLAGADTLEKPFDMARLLAWLAGALPAQGRPASAAR